MILFPIIDSLWMDIERYAIAPCLATIYLEAATSGLLKANFVWINAIHNKLVTHYYNNPWQFVTGMNIFVAFFLLLLLLTDNTPPAAASIPLIGKHKMVTPLDTSTLSSRVVEPYHHTTTTPTHHLTVKSLKQPCKYHQQVSRLFEGHWFPHFP